MNKEVKRLWLTALKSGKYAKGRGSLRRERPGERDCYCCLGVLCDLSITHHNTSSRWGDSSTSGTLPPFVFPYSSHNLDESKNKGFKVNDEGVAFVGSLPHEVMEWAGLTSDDTPKPYQSSTTEPAHLLAGP